MAGKIFTKEEADKLFGPVLESVAMDVKEFNSIMAKTEKNIMFKIVNNKLIVLGDGRSVIYPTGTAVKKEDVFALASKTIVQELLNNVVDSQVFVESRESNTTVTCGDNTLEELFWCPPICESN